MRPNRPSWPAKWRASNRCSASKGKDAGPFDRAGLQSLEREVGVFELEALEVGPDGDGRRPPQEVQGVLLRVARPARDRASPERFVVEVDRRNRRHVDAGDCERPATTQGLQRGGHQLASRRKHDRAMQLLGRRLRRTAHPDRPELTRQGLVLFAKRADVHRAAPVPGHLNDDVRRSPEPIEPQALAGLHSAEPQGAVADDARAEQWRRFLVTKDVRNRVGVIRGHHGVFRIAPVHVVPGKARLKTQILLLAEAELTRSTRMLQPGDADTVSFLDRPYAAPHPVHDADHFMARHNRPLGRRQFPLDDVQVGSADPADPDLHSHRIGTGVGQRKYRRPERMIPHIGGLLQHHGPHNCTRLRSHVTSPSCCARRNSRPSLTNSSDWVSVRSADATRFAGSLKNRSTSVSHSSRQSAFVPPMMRWAPTLPPFFRSSVQFALTNDHASDWVAGSASSPRNGFHRSWPLTSALRTKARTDRVALGSAKSPKAWR